MQKTPWAAKTNLKRSTFGRPCFNSFNHVFNCHAVCACVGDTTLPHHKANVCACVGNTTLPPTTANVCVCVGNTTLPPTTANVCVCVCVRWQYNPPPTTTANVYVCVRERLHANTVRWLPGTTLFVNALTSAVVTEQVPINTIFRERTRMCVCAGNTALATQPCPRNLYVSIQPRQAIQPCVPEASRQGHINLRVYQSACVSICVCINLRVYQSACVSICVCINLRVYQSACASILARRKLRTHSRPRSRTRFWRKVQKGK
jgi:hypothetical protein